MKPDAATRQFIPFAKPTIGQEEIEEAVAALSSGWLTTGPLAARFEQALREYAGCGAVVAVSSCTAALLVSYAAKGVGPGTEVIMSPMTFAATANVAVQLGATPRFVDIESETENIDPQLIADALSPRARLIVPVDFAGHPCELDQIQELARAASVDIVQDAAHSLGAQFRGVHVGSQPWPVCVSFYAIKNMTTGEGGAVLCPDDPELVARMRQLSLHGMTKDAWSRYQTRGKWQYDIVEPGYKCNLTDLQAAIGLHQLRRLDGFIAMREHTAKLYDEMFADSEVVCTPVVRPHVRHARHLYVIRLRQLPRGLDRATVIEKLEERGIGTTVNFIPLHLQSYYRDRFALEPRDFPVATAAFEQSVSLPLYPSLSDLDATYIGEQVLEIVGERGVRARKAVLPPNIVITGAWRSGTTLLMMLFPLLFEDTVGRPDEQSAFDVRLPASPKWRVSKLPNDIHKVRRLLDELDAYVVFLQRDPRDCLCSWSDRKRRYHLAFNEWQRNVLFSESVHTDRIIRVRFEDLVTRPDEVQRTLVDRIPGLVRKRSVAEAIAALDRPGPRGYQLARGSGPQRGGPELRPLDPSTIGTWRNDKPRVREQLQLFPELQAALEKHGYELDDGWQRELEG